MEYNGTSRQWTSEDLARLYQARTNKVPYHVIARQLGRSQADCESKWRDGTDWQTKLGFVDAIEQASRQGDKEALIKKLSDRLDNRLELNRLRADVLADRVVEAIKPFREVPAPKLYVPRRRDKSQNSSEDAGLMLSDLHIGQQFTLEETGGLGEYSLEVFSKRLKNLQCAVTDIIELHSQLYHIPKLNLFMLGDNVQGMNQVGAWSAAYIDMSIMDQLAAGVKAIADMIYYFLSIFEEVNVWGISGNHGRAAQKGVEKEFVNWDYLMYQFVEAHFANNPRVKFYCPKTWYIFTTIRNHRFLILHGEDIKGGNVPLNSLQRSEQKIAGLLGEHPHYTLAGHFHTAAELSTNHGELFLNGSFIGPDMHSLKNIQAGGRPTQKLFGIHDRWGVTWRYNLDLESERA